MKVLVVRLGAFGDIIHTLPLAADLAKAGHQVDWLCEDRWLPVLTGSPVLNSVHGFPRWALKGKATLLRRLSALRTMVRNLRAQRYDAVIDAQGLAKSALVAALCGAPLRIGHARERARELSWLVSKGKGPACAEHVIDQQRALALPLTKGCVSHEGWRFPLPAWAAEKGWAQEWLARRNLRSAWVLNVGAGWPTKVWPKRRQTEFIQLLKRNRQNVVLTWGNNTEYDLADEIVSEAEHGVLAPPTSIPQLAGLLARAEMVVSGDTGPLHLALALGTPAIGLFGPVLASRNGPRGRAYRNLQAPGAAWERKDASRVDMAAIGADDVWRSAQEIFNDRRGESAGRLTAG